MRFACPELHFIISRIFFLSSVLGVTYSKGNTLYKLLNVVTKICLSPTE